MKKYLLILFILPALACSLTEPTAATRADIFPTEGIPSPTLLATATEAAPMQCTVTATALHIRSGAGVSFPVVGYLRAGDIVSIQNQRGAWYAIGAGFIHSKYCEVKK